MIYKKSAALKKIELLTLKTFQSNKIIYKKTQNDFLLILNPVFKKCVLIFGLIWDSIRTISNSSVSVRRKNAENRPKNTAGLIQIRDQKIL